MWPWEHLAVGYLAYSLFERSRQSRPDTAGTLAVVIGSQLPDLLDKPLGWGTTLLPSGHSMAHSLLFAVPLALVAILLTRRLGIGRAGYGFGISYLLHLPADALYPMILGKDPTFGFLLWPLVPVAETAPVPLIERVNAVVEVFVVGIQTGSVALFLAAEVGLLTTTLLLWRADGWPGIDLLRGSRLRA
jgi:hypothetical protein